jgi:hypothetical protein
MNRKHSQTTEGEAKAKPEVINYTPDDRQKILLTEGAPLEPYLDASWRLPDIEPVP